MLRPRLDRSPRLERRPERLATKIGTALQKAIKSKQNALVGLVEIAERTHPLDVFAHEWTKEAGIGCRWLQALQFPMVIAHESAHDRGQARPVEPSELVERIPRYGAITVYPLQKAIEDAGTVTHEVKRPVQHAIVEPCFHKRDRRRTSMLPCEPKEPTNDACVDAGRHPIAEALLSKEGGEGLSVPAGEGLHGDTAAGTSSATPRRSSVASFRYTPVDSVER